MSYCNNFIQTHKVSFYYNYELLSQYVLNESYRISALIYLIIDLSILTLIL